MIPYILAAVGGWLIGDSAKNDKALFNDGGKLEEAAEINASLQGESIVLEIDKEHPKYQAFADIIDKIEEKGFMCWYGDITIDGREAEGIKITYNKR